MNGVKVTVPANTSVLSPCMFCFSLRVRSATHRQLVALIAWLHFSHTRLICCPVATQVPTLQVLLNVAGDVSARLQTAHATLAAGNSDDEQGSLSACQEQEASKPLTPSECQGYTCRSQPKSTHRYTPDIYYSHQCAMPSVSSPNPQILP